MVYGCTNKTTVFDWSMTNEREPDHERGERHLRERKQGFEEVKNRKTKKNTGNCKEQWEAKREGEKKIREE
jgi:hypothetical protein